MASGWGLAQPPHSWGSPVAKGSLDRMRWPGMQGRGCHGAHGAGDAIGPMVVLVGWVPSLHPRPVVPLGGPHNRRV